MSWITSMCPKCEDEIYAPFNRHAYAMDNDIRKGEQKAPMCGRCD